MHTNTNFEFFNGTPTASIENYHFRKISLKLLMWTWFAFKSKLQPKNETPELRNSSAVRRGRPVQGGVRGGGLMIYIRKQIPYKICHPKATNSGTMEKLTIENPTPNSQTFNVSNLYLPPENKHYLQRTGISLSEFQPDTKVHEVICADVNAHDTAWYQTANPNTRGEYLVNAAMDANSTFHNDSEQPTRQDPATGDFSFPEVIATFRDRYDWEPLDTLSSDHRPILITIHLVIQKLRGVYGSSRIGRNWIKLLLQQQSMNN